MSPCPIINPLTEIRIRIRDLKPAKAGFTASGNHLRTRFFRSHTDAGRMLRTGRTGAHVIARYSDEHVFPLDPTAPLGLELGRWTLTPLEGNAGKIRGLSSVCVFFPPSLAILLLDLVHLSGRLGWFGGR
jgi:hypothetical protein